MLGYFINNPRLIVTLNDRQGTAKLFENAIPHQRKETKLGNSTTKLSQTLSFVIKDEKEYRSFITPALHSPLDTFYEDTDATDNLGNNTS